MYPDPAEAPRANRATARARSDAPSSSGRRRGLLAGSGPRLGRHRARRRDRPTEWDCLHRVAVVAGGETMTGHLRKLVFCAAGAYHGVAIIYTGFSNT